MIHDSRIANIQDVIMSVDVVVDDLQEVPNNAASAYEYGANHLLRMVLLTRLGLTRKEVK
jgi:hypothetical protein